MDILKNRYMKPNDAVMFDIDDTLIFTDGRPNVPIINLLHAAKKIGYNIVIITARPGIEYVVQWTIRRIESVWYRVRLFGVYDAETKYLMKQHLPYNFILSIGDMPTDLTGSPYAINTSNSYHN